MVPEKSFLQSYGEFAAKHTKIVLLVAFVITLFMVHHAVSIEIETDFYKTLPQDLEALQNQNFLEKVFSESDSMFILVKLNNEESMPKEFKDIRDYRLMDKVLELENLLRDNPKINSVFGAPDILVASMGGVPEDTETIVEFFGQSESLFGRDYSLTTLIVNLEGKVELEDIDSVVDVIEEDIRSIGFPGSVKLTVTGGPLISKTISDLIFEDLFSTLSLAGVLIFLMLMFSYRSFLRGFFSISILILAVLWTAGTMVILDIPLSIVTVTVGSLIIGIGIDYAIHIINRYNEERGIRRDDEKKDCIEGDYGGCMKTCFVCYGVAVDKVGRAIIGTAVTTIASFLALTLSGIPFLGDMGIVLSLGIFYAMILSLFFLPSFLSIRDKINYNIKNGLKRRLI